MKLSHALSSTLSSTLISAAVVTLGMSVAHATTVAESDILRITLPGTLPIDYVIPEGAAAGGMEPGAVFNPLPGVLDGTTLDISFALSRGAHFVYLTEPAGTIPEPGEIAVPVPCPSSDPTGGNGPCILSDIAVGFQDTTGPHVGFYSDPHQVFFDPMVQQILPQVTLLWETGQMQDVSQLLGFDPASLKVEVMSDVPVPAAAWLFASGLGLLGLSRRKGD